MSGLLNDAAVWCFAVLPYLYDVAVIFKRLELPLVVFILAYEIFYLGCYTLF